MKKKLQSGLGVLTVYARVNFRLSLLACSDTLLSLLSLYLIKSRINCKTSRGHWECTFLTDAIATGKV